MRTEKPYTDRAASSQKARVSTMATMNEAIYNYMQGPSEFTITETIGCSAMLYEFLYALEKEKTK